MPCRLLVSLGLMLVASGARAAEPAPPAVGAARAGLAVARDEVSAVSLAPELHPPRVSLGLAAHFGVAAVAGVAAVPTGLLLARWLGHLSNHFLVAGLSGLAGMVLVAPAVVTLAAWLAWGPPRAGAWPTLRAAAIAVLLNVVTTGIAALAGLSLGAPLGVVLFSLANGAALGGATVLALRGFERAPPTMGPADPSKPPGPSAPLCALSF